MPLPGPYASAAQMSAALASREVSSAELTEAAIARIEACESKLNAVCVRTFDLARAAAKAADARLGQGERGALLGVPMTLKESYNLVGTPTTWGVEDARDYLPPEDALAVQRVKAAGLVIVGKTNVPVGLGDWQSFNPIYGVTNNPYDLTRTPGGSSGGSAAAIAAGYAPLSLGSDIGGSLRTPANFCGIFSHKPTHDLVPPRGHVPPRVPAIPNAGDFAVIGPMARTAEDCEALLDVVAGPDERQEGIGYRLALPPARHGRLDQFRVLVIDRHPLAETDATVVGAIGALADKLERAGAEVSRKSDLLPDLAVAGRLFQRMLGAIIGARMPEAPAEAATATRDERNASALQPQGPALTYREWFAASGQRSGIRARWQALFRTFDAVICPIAPTPAYPHDHTPDQSARRLIVNGLAVPYGDTLHWAGVATLPGLPATALPIGRSPDGLPIGAQIMGPWLEDRTTLALARLIEAEFGGFSPPPAFS